MQKKTSVVTDAAVLFPKEKQHAWNGHFAEHGGARGTQPNSWNRQTKVTVAQYHAFQDTPVRACLLSQYEGLSKYPYRVENYLRYNDTVVTSMIWEHSVLSC